MASQELLDQFGIAITEIGSIKQANALLEKTSQLGVLKSDKVQNNLKYLLECSRDASCKTYFVGVDGKNWAVVADSQESIEPFLGSIQDIDTLQRSINPDKLVTNCIYVHEFAATSGYADGIFARGGSIADTSKTIYPNKGLHRIAYRDNARAGKRMFIDLTPKAYSFAKTTLDATTAVLEGLIVIDRIGNTNNLEKIYRTKWVQDSFDPDVSRAERREEWGKFFSNVN